MRETERIASGFGGAVCHGSLEEHPELKFVTKQMYRDSEDEELFEEVAVGMLIPSSPYLGFATTIAGAPRLISAYGAGVGFRTEGSDFGSVSREGDVPPMTCNSYRPPRRNFAAGLGLFLRQGILRTFWVDR